MRFRALKALVLAVPFLVVGEGQAQGQARLGPMVGGNLASIGGEDAEDFSSLVGFVFGGFAQFELSPRLAIQPQLLYSMKGAKDKVDDTKIKLNYFQVPVLAQVRFPGNSNATPYLVVGPSLGFKASCKLTFEGGSEDCDDTDVASTDFSLIGGVGVEVGNNVSIALRYDYGLTKLDKGEFPDEVFNRVITLTVGYGVRLNR